jgi:hypothetical protein
MGMYLGILHIFVPLRLVFRVIAKGWRFNCEEAVS